MISNAPPVVKAVEACGSSVPLGFCRSELTSARNHGDVLQLTSWNGLLTDDGLRLG